MENSSCEVCQMGYHFDEKGECVSCSVNNRA